MKTKFKNISIDDVVVEWLHCFYDVRNEEFVLLEEDLAVEDIPGDWRALPEQEYLLPKFGTLFHEYIDERGLDFPESGCRPGEFLRENELKYDFEDYKQEKLKGALQEWIHSYE